jgi:thiol-disulfide isomerase/thioredoxin
VVARKSIFLLSIVIALGACSPKPPSEYDGRVSFMQGVTPADTRGEGSPVPDFHWLDASGSAASFREYARGKPALINFWATWLPQSRVQLPELKKLAREYTPKGVVILGVNAFDWKDPPSLTLDYVSRFTTDWKLNFPVIIEGKERGESPLWNAFGLHGALPVSVLVDRQGRIVKTLTGIQSHAQLAAELDKLL